MESTPIDTQHLSDMSGGDTTFETELLQEFLECTPPLIRELERAIGNGDLRAALISAHTLKGSCRSLGAFPMSNPCEILETMARNGNLEGGAQLHATLVEEFERMKTFVFQNWNLKAA